VSAALSVQSMGWGKQTFMMAAEAALQEAPRADLYVFADTGHELQGTYEFIRQWEPWLRERGLNTVTVRADNTDPVQTWHSQTDGVMIPAFTRDRATGEDGQVGRQCTMMWKIRPIRRFIRAELARRGLRATPGIVESWQGISFDEWQRMRTSDAKYITNRYPLVDRRITRAGCIAWLEGHGLPVPPKSSCTFCPFHSLGEWKRLKRAGGTDWREAVAVDALVRDKRSKMALYVHPGRKPLPEAVDIPEDHGAMQMELDGFCEGGHCGV